VWCRLSWADSEALYLPDRLSEHWSYVHRFPRDRLSARSSPTPYLGRTPLVDVSALDAPRFEQDAYRLEVDCV
jgi:hypothetical protein